MNQGEDLVAVPGYRPFDPHPGLSYIETAYGWGKVVKRQRNGTIIVSLFKRRPDPGKQDFPEWDMQQWAERLRIEHIASGKHKPKGSR